MTGKEIEKIRKCLGMTQAELAEALGVSFSTISRWETSKSEPDDKQEEQLQVLKELAEKEEIDKKKLRKLLIRIGIAGVIPLAVIGGINLTSTLARSVAALLGVKISDSNLANIFLNQKKEGGGK